MDAPELTEDLVDFVESGVSILIATRDADRIPDALRGVGARVHDDRRHFTVLLPEATGARAVENLRDNGAIAVTFSRPTDHQGVQLKGQMVAIRPSGDVERMITERYRAAFFEQLYVVGVPRTTSRRLAYWPSVAVDVRVDAVFRQTPGPGAGQRLAEEP